MSNDWDCGCQKTSIMDRIKLTFSNVGPKDPLLKKKAEYPEQ